MNRNLMYALLAGMLLLSLTGCAGMSPTVTAPAESEPRQNLTCAVNMIRAGLDNEARHYLELVIAYSRQEGVTDEALFRLALLNLNGGNLGDGKSSAALLDTLRLGYPSSVWTRQAAPLHSYLSAVKKIPNRDREINALQDKNLSLSRDVRELRLIIERLKALDSELEQKIKR